MTNVGSVLQVQRHAPHVRLVADVFRQDLEHHRKADARGFLGGGFGVGRHGAGGHHGDAIGLAYGLGFGLGQHVAAAGQHLLDDGAHAGYVRGWGVRTRTGGGRLRQLRLILGVALQHADGGHGLFRHVVAGDARVHEDLARLGHGGSANPAGNQRKGRALGRQHDRHHGAGDVGRWHDRRGRLDEQQRAGGLRVARQHLQRVHVALRGRVANDVHRVVVRPVGRQHGVQLAHHQLAQRGQGHALGGARVRGHHAGAAAVGQDGHAVADRGAKARQDLGCQEELLQAVHAQHARAGDGGVVHLVRASQRPRVRGRGAAALFAAAGLHGDHRLVARGRAGGRHELARIVDRFDVQQDGARLRVVGQVVQHVAEVHVGVFAQRNEVRKADVARLGPVQHGGDQRARLRDEGQLPGPRRDVRKACVQPGVRRQQAHAVGAQDAHQARAGDVQHGLLLLGRQARGDDHHRLGAALGQLAHQLDHGGRRCADHGQLGRFGQLVHAGVAAAAVQLFVLRVHRVDRSAKAAGAHVAPQRAADRVGPAGRADHGDGLGLKQRIKMASAHVRACLWLQSKNPVLPKKRIGRAPSPQRLA